MEFDSNELTVPYRTFSRFRASLAQIHKHTEQLKKLAPLLRSQASTLRRRRKLTSQALHFSQSTSATLASTLTLLQEVGQDNDPNGVVHINSAHEFIAPDEPLDDIHADDGASSVHIGAPPMSGAPSVPADSPSLAVEMAQCHSLEPPDCALVAHSSSEASSSEVESSHSGPDEGTSSDDDDWI